MSVVPPPPAPARGGDGCWKYGALTCGGLGCLAILAFTGLMIYVMRSPQFKEAMDSIQQAGTVAQDIKQVAILVDRYAQVKKKYPEKLEDLVPEYLDKSKLRPSAYPDGPEYTYTRPPKDAPPSFVILQYDVKTSVGTSLTIRARKDGQVETSTPGSGGFRSRTFGGSEESGSEGGAEEKPTETEKTSTKEKASESEGAGKE